MTADRVQHEGQPVRRRLNAMFGSDIGHWDVPDMADVLGEAWEMVEHGLHHRGRLPRLHLRAPVRFYTHTNPSFFEGTPVEEAVVERRYGRPSRPQSRPS